MRSASSPAREGTDPLSPAEHEAWQAFQAGSGTVLSGVQARLEADAGMSLTSFNILDTLACSPHHQLRMGALAAALHASTSRLAHAIRRLEDCGWVRRDAHPSDRRGHIAVLTDTGRTAHRTAISTRDAAVRRELLSSLTAEQITQLHQICQTLRTAPAADPSRRTHPAVPAQRSPGS